MNEHHADVQAIRDRTDRVLAGRRPEIWPTIRDRIADVLGIEASTIEPSSNLIDALGATSLDFLDLVYRLEADFDIKIARGAMQLAIEQGIEQPYESGGRLTAAALERLGILMPEAAGDARLGPGLRSHQLTDLYRAETFVRFVATAMSDAAEPSMP